MNIKCLQAVSAADDAASSSPSSSLSSSSSLAATCRLIEGDRFAALILDALKLVAQHYGEQVIVLHYFTHVSNTVAACASRLTLRLESSLIGGLVLVSYFLHYLDIKVLMDTLNVSCENRSLIENAHKWNNSCVVLVCAEDDRVASDTAVLERAGSISQRLRCSPSARLQAARRDADHECAHRRRADTHRDARHAAHLLRRLHHTPQLHTN